MAALREQPPSFDVVKEEAFKGELGAKAEGIAKLLGKASIGG